MCYWFKQSFTSIDTFMQYNSIQQHAEHSQSDCLSVLCTAENVQTVCVHVWGGRGREQSTKPYYTYKSNSFKFWWCSACFIPFHLYTEQGFLCPHCVPWKSLWLARAVWPLPDAFASNLTYCQRTWPYTKFYTMDSLMFVQKTSGHFQRQIQIIYNGVYISCCQGVAKIT